MFLDLGQNFEHLWRIAGDRMADHLNSGEAEDYYANRDSNGGRKAQFPRALAQPEHSN